MRNLDLDIEDQGHPSDYVGVNIKQMKDGSIGLSQRALIDTIIQDADLQDSKVKAVPAKVNEHLHAHLDKPPFSLNFNYRSMIGKVNYLAQTTRPAKYSLNPREPHGDAALYLVRYLKKSCDIGIRFQPDPNRGFECYCNTNFSGLWNKQFACHDPSTSKSLSTQDALSFGNFDFKPRLPCRPLKPNTSRCLSLYKTFSPSASSSRK